MRSNRRDFRLTAGSGALALGAARRSIPATGRGGSGHGFKHGPALGEYVAARVRDGQPVEPRFSLAAEAKVQEREVH